MAEGLNKYDLNELLKGPCSVLYAKRTSETSLPQNIADIFEPDGEPYKQVSPWNWFGATTAGTAYSSQFTTAGYQIEQANGNVDEDVTDVVRTVQATFGQVTPELIQMFEQASNIDSVEAAKGRSSEKQIRTGSFESLTEYMIAFVGRRLKGKGADVTESGGNVRGAFVVGGLNAAKMTGDQKAIQLAKGQLASAPLTFQAYPDNEEETGEEHGFWFIEESGTIEAAE